VVVATRASEEVIKQRLDSRKRGSDPKDKSDADWTIYKKMIKDQQKVGRNFISADTSGDVAPVINKVIRMIKN
jgi:predicted kinase